MDNRFIAYNSIELCVIEKDVSIFECYIKIEDQTMKCLYADHFVSDHVTINSIAYNDDQAILIGASDIRLLSHTIAHIKKQYKVFSNINWDHLFYSPDTFLKVNHFIHYSEKKLSVISPLTLNVGNRLSGLTASSFWTIPEKYYPNNLYDEKTGISNLIFVFYRRLVKSVFPQTKDIVISTEKDIKIYIRSSFYITHFRELNSYSIYEYHYSQYGFFASLGGEYSIKEYTFDYDIRPNSCKVIYFKDYMEFVEVLENESFEEKKRATDIVFKRHHFCELINKNKPPFYYDYEELITRRNEINSSRTNTARKLYTAINNTDIFRDLDIIDDILITADLHLGKTSQNHVEICNEIDGFWNHNRLNKDHLLLLGDIIDADYLTDDEYIDITKYFLSKAPAHTVLVVGNNDRDNLKALISCGYEYVATEIVLGKYVFTHMPVPTDGVAVNVHGHLHGRTNYLNITPYHHIDIGYKANGYQILTLREYIASKSSSADNRKRQDIDIFSLFDASTLSLFNSYRKIYCLNNLFSENQAVGG